MIRYTTSIDGIGASQLNGFFVDWPHPPSPENHMQILRNSDHVVLALENTGNSVVGFITAISDGILSAYIPLLEVLPEFQAAGIGSHLVKTMLLLLEDFYMVDLVCDPELEGFYTRFGLNPGNAMSLRNYRQQSGRELPGD